MFRHLACIAVNANREVRKRPFCLKAVPLVPRLTKSNFPLKSNIDRLSSSSAKVSESLVPKQDVMAT